MLPIQMITALFIVLFTLPAYANPQSADLVARGLDAAAAGKPEDAYEFLQQAVKADAADAEAHYHFGLALLQAGDTAAGTTELRTADAAGFQPAGAALGAAYFKASAFELAEKQLRTALKRNPADLEAHHFLGLTLFKLGKYEEAISHLDQSLASIDREAEAGFYKGLALLRLGKKEEASGVLSDAAALGEGESSLQARLLLKKLEEGNPYRLHVDLFHQIDTNVILAQTNRNATTAFTPGEISNRRGNRWVGTLGGTYTRAITNQYKFSAGYAGYQSYHRTHRDLLQKYDVSSHTLWAKGSTEQGQWLAQLPIAVNFTGLGPVANPVEVGGTTPEFKGYTRNLTASPSFLYSLGKNQGIGAGYILRFERFLQEPGTVVLPDGPASTDRSNTTNGLELQYYLQVTESAFISPSTTLFSSNAHGDPNIWDHRGAEIALRSAYPLYTGLTGNATFSAAYHDYLTQFPVATAGGTGSIERNDRLFTALAGLLWERGAARATASVSWQRNLSTADVFDYSRMIYSLGIGASL